MTFTGHSLGGGLAALAALVTGDPAITFNAASLSDPTLEKYGVDNLSQNNIAAFAVRYAPLTMQQDNNIIGRNFFGLNSSQGIRFTISTPYLHINIFDYHRIDTVIEALGGD